MVRLDRLMILLSLFFLLGNLYCAPLQTISIDELERGMSGYGLTVMAGREPIKFKVEVVDVLRNFGGPKRNAFLVRMIGKEVERTRVASGMSGSPIFIKERLAGALAFAWPFGSEPIGGVTPITEMLVEGERKIPSKDEMGEISWPPVRNSSKEKKVTVPLACSGFSEMGLKEMERLLGPCGFIPQHSGGQLAKSYGKLKPLGRPLRGGDAVGVQLVRGDMSATAIGTVTCVVGDRILAFGHSFFEAGFWNAPMCAAEVNHVLASQHLSFKIATPLEVVGSLFLDRPSCIVGEKGVISPMAKVTIHCENKRSQRKKSYNLEIIRHRFLTGRLVGTALQNVLNDIEGTQEPLTLHTELKVKLDGYEPFTLTSRAFTDGGGPLDIGVALSLISILNNSFGPVHLKELEARVTVYPQVRPYEIKSVVLCKRSVRQGESFPLRVEFERYGGKRQYKILNLSLPKDYPVGHATFKIGSGDQLQREEPEAQSVKDLIEQASRQYLSSSLIARLKMPYWGMGMEGRRYARLPGVAFELLNNDGSTTVTDIHDEVFTMPWVIWGSKSISIQVKRRLRP